MKPSIKQRSILEKQNPLEILLSIPDFKKYKVESVRHRTPAEKYDYALRLYTCMWSNPVFEDMMPIVELLKRTAIRLSDLYLDETKRDTWETTETLNELDCIIETLHNFVENFHDKASAFIRSTGMKPVISVPL